MFGKKEMANLIVRQGESIIALNNRITQLNQKVENQKAVISEQNNEVVDIYANLKETRKLKEEAEIRATEFARKLKKIEELVDEIGEFTGETKKQDFYNIYIKLKNVLVNSDTN